MALETLHESMQRLYDLGFTESFTVEEGRLRAVEFGATFAPAELRVETVDRFEGESDPADSAILFALVVPGGDLRGTWSVPYGPNASPEEVAMVQLLERGRVR